MLSNNADTDTSFNGLPQAETTNDSTCPFKAFVATRTVWLVWSPILLASGTFGNILTIAILMRMQLRNTAMPTYLTALAVSDTVVLYTGLLDDFLRAAVCLSYPASHNFLCKVKTWLLYACSTLSNWLLTLTTLERALSVRKPQEVKRMCTARNAVFLIVGVTAFFLVVHAKLLVDFKVDTGVNEAFRVCAVDSNMLHVHLSDYLDLVFFCAIPAVIIVTSNGLIIRGMCVRTRSSLESSGSSLNKQKVSSMTISLIFLSILFLLTTIPVSLYNVMEENLADQYRESPHGLANLAMCKAIVKLMWYTNSAVNYFVYTMSGSRFRREIVQCICRRRPSVLPSTLVSSKPRMASGDALKLHSDRRFLTTLTVNPELTDGLNRDYSSTAVENAQRSDQSLPPVDMPPRPQEKLVRGVRTEGPKTVFFSKKLSMSSPTESDK